VKGYKINDFVINNCIIEVAADITVIDFTKGSAALNIEVSNSTIYATAPTTKSMYSSQGGEKADAYGATAENPQMFRFLNSTIYNFAKSKNFFSHRQSNQKWLGYEVKNSIFVGCGKSCQVIKGMNGGQSGKNPTWIIEKNTFNFDGADTSAAEDTADEDEPVKDNVVGVVEFAILSLCTPKVPKSTSFSSPTSYGDIFPVFNVLITISQSSSAKLSACGTFTAFSSAWT